MLKQVSVRHRMSVDYLRGFLEVARLGSFSRAATTLYRSQPTLSQQIRMLEREYGEKLFDRDYKTVRLTPAGVTLRRYAEDIVSLRAEAIEQIGQCKHSPHGSLQIGTNDATCLYVLPPALASFRRLYPSVQVSIYRNFSHKIMEKVREGAVEVGIVSLPRVDKTMEVIPIFSSELKVVLPAGHPLLKKEAVTPGEISYYPLLLPKVGRTRRMIDSLLRPYRKSLQISMELASVEVIKKFVCAGIGISLLPEAFAQTEIASGTLGLVPLQGRKIYRELGLVYRRSGSLSAPARGFISMVCDSVRPFQPMQVASVG